MDYVSWITTFFNNLTMTRMGQVLALSVITSIVIALYKLHTNKSNPFDLSDLFVDQKTKHIDGSMFRMNLAFFVSTWVIVFAMLNDHMTEWLFAAYLSAWVADRKFSRDAAALVIKPSPSVDAQSDPVPNDSTLRNNQ